MFTRLLAAALVLFAVAVGVSTVTPVESHAASGVTEFRLRDINNAEVNLSDYKGKVIVLSFWATWCAPCKEEMPHLDKMYREFKEKGFVVLSISSDDARTASRVKPFIRSKGFSFPVLLDKDGSVTNAYNPQKTMPWTVVIDQNFEIAKVHSGFNPGDEEELRHFVAGLLGAEGDHAEK